MKHAYQTLALTASALVLAGCPRSEPPAQYPIESSTPQKSTANPLVPVVAALEKRVKEGEERQRAIESELSQERTSRSRWKTTALIGVSVAIGFLLLGALAGTQANDHANKNSP